MTINEVRAVMYKVDAIMVRCEVTDEDYIYLSTLENELEDALQSLEKAGVTGIRANLLQNVLYVGE